MAPAKKEKASKTQKAAKAAAAVKKAPNAKKSKIRTHVHFYRPKVRVQKRNPKYPSKAVNHLPRMDKYRVLKYPLTTESAMKKIEEINTLVFICDQRANKHQIKSAVHDMYDVQCAKVNTMNRLQGDKKAYVKLTPDFDALDVANRIGII